MDPPPFFPTVRVSKHALREHGPGAARKKGKSEFFGGLEEMGSIARQAMQKMPWPDTNQGPSVLIYEFNQKFRRAIGQSGKIRLKAVKLIMTSEGQMVTMYPIRVDRMR